MRCSVPYIAQQVDCKGYTENRCAHVSNAKLEEVTQEQKTLITKEFPSPKLSASFILSLPCTNILWTVVYNRKSTKESALSSPGAAHRRQKLGQKVYGGLPADSPRLATRTVFPCRCYSAIKHKGKDCQRLLPTPHPSQSIPTFARPLMNTCQETVTKVATASLLLINGLLWRDRGTGSAWNTEE